MQNNENIDLISSNPAVQYNCETFNIYCKQVPTWQNAPQCSVSSTKQDSQSKLKLVRFWMILFVPQN